MIEAEWLVCDDPRPMLEFLGFREGVQKNFIDLSPQARKLKAGFAAQKRFFLDRALRTLGDAAAVEMAENVNAFWRCSARKTRLFAVAFCRRIYQLPKDKMNLQAIDIAERFADGLATEDELTTAQEKLAQEWSKKPGQTKRAVLFTLGAANLYTDWGLSEATLAANAVARAAVRKEKRTKRASAELAERAAQASLLRCIFPDPFRPVLLDSAILDWRGGTVRKLAASIYDERAFARLPVLADTLEEAGCVNILALKHCRQPVEHVRGCWVVDLILDKK